jgi:hypothetical protein
MAQRWPFRQKHVLAACYRASSKPSQDDTGVPRFKFDTDARFARYAPYDTAANITEPPAKDPSAPYQVPPVFEVNAPVRLQPRPHLLSRARTFSETGLRWHRRLRSTHQFPEGRESTGRRATRTDVYRAFLVRNRGDAGQYLNAIPLGMEATVDFEDWRCLDKGLAVCSLFLPFSLSLSLTVLLPLCCLLVRAGLPSPVERQGQSLSQA